MPYVVCSDEVLCSGSCCHADGISNLHWSCRRQRRTMQ